MWVIPRNVSFYSQRIVDTDRLWKKEHCSFVILCLYCLCAVIRPDSSLRFTYWSVHSSLPFVDYSKDALPQKTMSIFVGVFWTVFFLFLFYYRRGVKSVSLQMRWVKTGVHLFGRILINWRNLLFTVKNKNARSLGHLGDGILKKK